MTMPPEVWSMEFNSLLVPLDLSPLSPALVQHAVAMATGENPVVILLHVIDPNLIDFAESHELGKYEDIAQRMRDRALRELEQFRTQVSGQVEVEILVCEGAPFLQIIQKAQEFLADAIIMGKAIREGPTEKLLFGSTAEKVLRGSTRPVVVLPLDG